MKLSKKFYTQQVAGLTVAVSPDYKGIIQLTESAEYIMSLLEKECTREELIEKMYDQYDAPKETLSADIDAFLAGLREKGLLEE